MTSQAASHPLRSDSDYGLLPVLNLEDAASDAGSEPFLKAMSYHRQMSAIIDQNSEGNGQPTAILERPLRFESAAEFQSRALYRENIDGKGKKLLKMVGGYSFAKANNLRCGLKGCRQKHGTGFVVLLEGDIETNIGHCCGRSTYHMVWHEMEATFERAEKAFIVQSLYDKISSTREQTLDSAKKLQTAVIDARRSVAPILEVLSSEKSIRLAFDQCRKNYGTLKYFRALTADERELSPGQSTIPVRIGKIDGISAADPHELERELRFKVIVPLEEWTSIAQTKMNPRQLEDVARNLAALGEVIQRAEIYVHQAARFVKAENWIKFEEFCVLSRVNISRSNMNSVRKIAGLPTRNW